MDRISFPGWAGPGGGAVVGVALGLGRGVDAGQGASAPYLALWALAGAVAGGGVWLLDARYRHPYPDVKQDAIRSVFGGG